MTRQRHRWFGVLLLLVYCLAGIPASYANWYQEIQQANQEGSIPYQVWVPGQNPQLQSGGKPVDVCTGSISNVFPAQQTPHQVTQRKKALEQGLTCMQKTAAQVEDGQFPALADGLTNAVLFTDGFIHGFRDGFEQSATGVLHFIYALFTHPGQLEAAVRKLIEHPSILYHIMQKLTGHATQAFAEIVCSPAYAGGKAAGKIVGNVAFMVITAEAGGAAAKSVASFSRELAELGISETGAVGQDITIDALHNIQDALRGAYKTFKSGGSAYLKVGSTILKSGSKNAGDMLVFTTADGGPVPEDVVKQVFLKLAGTDNLPPPTTVLNKEGLEKGIRYTIKTPEGNFTLRDFATSNTQVTGGKSWTIDVPKNSPLREQIGEEIKFAR